MALRSRKVVLVVGAVVLAVASPLAFALGSAEVGGAVSASVIAATAVAALAVRQRRGRGGLTVAGGWRPKRKERRPGKPDDPAGAREVGGGDEEATGLRAEARSTGPATVIGGGIAVSGVYIGQSVRQEAPRQPAPWPHLVGSPPGRALGFQERAEASRLAGVLEGEGTAVVGQVLSGLGGVGKTQIAADYARAAFEAGGLDVLVWVTAASRRAVIDAYARAAVELLAIEPDERAAQRFLDWLHPSASRPVCRWLVVLDDLADPADLTDPAYPGGLWPPASPHGRTIVTTRRRDAALTGPGRRRVDVGVYSPVEAEAALHRALAERDHSAQRDEHIRALAAELGFLPLAISQAAAYIADAGLDVAGYRTRLADRTRTLADLLPRPGQPGEPEDALPDGQATTVAATWSLSLERADLLHPHGLAHPMLQLTALLDPNGIPETVLTSAPALKHLTTHRTPPPAPGAPRASAPRRASAPAPGEAGEEDAVAALRALRRLSLIEHTPDQPSTAVRVHQLVQRTTREALGAADQEQLARTAADALLAAWPIVEYDTGIAQSLRANTTALHRTAGDALYTPATHSVLFRTGHSLGDTGQAVAARDHFHHVHTHTAQLLGPDHLHTLVARGDLTYWQGEAGDAAGAATALAELLKDDVRVLGPDHPNTLATRANLARFRGEAGDAAGAATALAELLPELVRVFGPDRPETLIARANLARFRGQAGDAAGAATALAELLPELVRVFGPDHPETLIARANLACFRGQAGDAAGAATAHAELLPELVRLFGPDHPNTLATRRDFARWRGQAGDAAGAATTCAELLKDHVRVFGSDHPDTLTIRSNLAVFRGEAGDAVGAATALAELLPELVRVFGPDHPDTLTTRSNLAASWGMAGDGAGAVRAYAELLADQVRLLGADHAEALATRGDLAYWRGEAGEADGAAAAFAKLLADLGEPARSEEKDGDSSA